MQCAVDVCHPKVVFPIEAREQWFQQWSWHWSISGPLDAQLVFQLYIESQLILMWIDLRNRLWIALILQLPFIVYDGSDGRTLLWIYQYIPFSPLLFVVSITFLIYFWLLLFKLCYLEATDIFLHFSHRKHLLSNDRNIGNMFRLIRKFPP